MKKREPVAIFEQYNQCSKKITALSKTYNFDIGINQHVGETTYAVFRVYIKRKSLLHKLFPKKFACFIWDNIRTCQYQVMVRFKIGSFVCKSGVDDYMGGSYIVIDFEGDKRLCKNAWHTKWFHIDDLTYDI